MLAYTFYDGDNRVMRYAETLARRGEQVDVISLRYREEPAVQMLNGVRVVRIQTRKAKGEGRLAYLVGTIVFMLRAMVLLTTRHMKYRYDLIHVHSVPDFLIFATWILRLTGCKAILDIHDVLPEFYASRFRGERHSLSYKLLLLEERASAAMAHHVIISNHLWYDRVVARSVKNGNCTVIINAVDRSIFHPAARRPCDDKFIVLYPGSLNWHQGVDLAIRAVGRLKDRVRGLELHICGIGPEKPALCRLVRDLELQDRVLFLEARPLREMAKLMRTVDLGVVPKRTDSFGNEAFSTKVLEFMASGIPVLVAETKVERYYYDDSIAEFFRGGDEADLAAKLLELIENRQRREDLVRNARHFIETNDWGSIQKVYVDLVEGLTGQCMGADAALAGGLDRIECDAADLTQEGNQPVDPESKTGRFV